MDREPGVDRRGMLKRGAVAGAAVWTAPAVIGSLSSAGAASPLTRRGQVLVPGFGEYDCDFVFENGEYVAQNCTPAE